MIRKSTLIFIILCILLGGLAIGFQQGWFEKSSAISTPTSTPTLLDTFPVENLATITVSENNSVTLELNRTAGHTWDVLQPSSIPVDAGKVEQLLSALYALAPISQVTADTPLESLGIFPGSRNLTLSDNSGRKMVLKPGGPTPTGNSYFMQVDNQIPVVISKFGYEELEGFLSLSALQAATPTP
jgi:hypothetical protein